VSLTVRPLGIEVVGWELPTVKADPDLKAMAEGGKTPELKLSGAKLEMRWGRVGRVA
jgi:hypothetical protein